MLQFIVLAKLFFIDFQDKEKPGMLFSAAPGASPQYSIQLFALSEEVLPALPTATSCP